MPTATETRNGAQAAIDETSRSAVQAFDALTEYYLAAFDTGLKVQARAIETGKLLLDESMAFQRANRKLAEELLKTAGKTQRELVEAAQTDLRMAQAAWLGADKR